MSDEEHAFSDEDEYDSEEQPCGCGTEDCYGVDCDYEYYASRGYLNGVPSDHSDSGSESDEEQEGPADGPLHELGQALAIRPDHGHVGLSFSGAADFLPRHPTMLINGMGEVTFPLDQAQAERIASVCEQAPFGIGRSTMFDTAVRHSWQLSPASFDMQGEEWQSGLGRAKQMLADRYGMEGIKIRPYKFLLYKPGGHFRLHRDTEKEDGMFATMVVQLPSRHRGGILQVAETAHGSADATLTTTHDFGQAAGTAHEQCHYAVHYADAEHAVTPVTEGYRAAIIYSICWPDAGSAATIVPSARVAAALQDLGKEQTMFIHFLQHEYTPKALSQLGTGALKGVDRRLIAQLDAANRTLQSPYRLLLAKAERRRPGYMDGDEWLDEAATDETFETYTMHGKLVKKLASRMPPGFASYLNPERKSLNQLWKGHRSVRYEGYLGNEGATKDTTYHKVVLLALPTGDRGMAAHLEMLGLETACNLYSPKENAGDSLLKLMQIARERRIKPPAEPANAKGDQFRYRLLDVIFSHPHDSLDALVTLYLQIYQRQDFGRHWISGVSTMCSWLFAETSGSSQGTIRAWTYVERIVQHPCLWSEKASTRRLVLDICRECNFTQILSLADVWRKAEPTSKQWLYMLTSDKSLRASKRMVEDSGSDPLNMYDKEEGHVLRRNLERMWLLAVHDASGSYSKPLVAKLGSLGDCQLGPTITALYNVYTSGEDAKSAFERLLPTFSTHLKRRKQWLLVGHATLRSQGPASWALPTARLPDVLQHSAQAAEISRFLRGRDVKTRIKTTGIKPARELAVRIQSTSRYDTAEAWQGKVTATANGVGAKSGVDIVKVSQWQSMRDKDMADLQGEIDSIAKMLGESDRRRDGGNATSSSWCASAKAVWDRHDDGRAPQTTTPKLGDKRNPIELIDDDVPDVGNLERPAKTARAGKK